MLGGGVHRIAWLRQGTHHYCAYGRQQEDIIRLTQRLVGAITLGVPLAFDPSTASAQDPAVVNAKTIHVTFENDRVRVLEATLPPGVKEQGV